jgi:uncharacterized protein (TIGR00251 family)
MTVTLSVNVIPNARVDQVVEKMADGTLKIRVRAKAIEGKANTALVRFLSEQMGVDVADVEIVAGKHSRKKMVRIAKVTQGQVLQKLLRNQADP